jgi:hypothetical protein
MALCQGAHLFASSAGEEAHLADARNHTRLRTLWEIGSLGPFSVRPSRVTGIERMQDSLFPLTLSAGAFLAVLIWRVRPLAPWTTKRRASREALQQARLRIESASEGRDRALALCDAADLVARQVRGPGDAVGLYLRAIRSDPKSADVVQRAVAGLARRPRALESLLWRYLAAASWVQAPDAAAAALDALRTLYEGPRRNAVRARAIANAREALKR